MGREMNCGEWLAGALGHRRSLPQIRCRIGPSRVEYDPGDIWGRSARLLPACAVGGVTIPDSSHLPMKKYRALPHCCP